MYIWKRFSSVPNLTLGKDEKQLLFEISASSENKSINELLRKLQAPSNPILENSTTCSHPKGLAPAGNQKCFKDMVLLLNCLEQWDEFVFELYTWNQKISTLYHLLTNKVMGNDDLLPITIILLPQDLDQLKEFNSKIEDMCRLEQHGESAFYLINLCAAINFKLMNQGNAPLEDVVLCKIANKIRGEYQFFELRRACLSYKSDVLSEFLNQFAIVDKNRYEQYFIKEKDQDINKLMLTMLETEGKKLFKLKNKEFLFLLNKYLILLDLQFALQRDRYSTKKKLIEFAEKFTCFDVWMKNNRGHFSWDQLNPFTFFKKQKANTTSEEYFFDIAKLYCTDIIDKEDEELKAKFDFARFAY